jgi:pimeloyl-ACP methyl ester carboxylesterase
MIEGALIVSLKVVKETLANTMAEKTPLVLLPGLLCDTMLFEAQLAALSNIAEPFIADLTRDDSLAAMAQRVLAAAPARFALAGLSLGGYVAQEIMRRSPERVSRLALLDTSARPDTLEQSARRRGLLELTAKGEFKSVTARLLPLLVHPGRLKDSALIDTITAMAARVGADAFVRQQRAIMGRPDGRADLARIEVPTLVLCGREDQLTPLEVNQEMASLIPSAAFTVIERCGHLSTLERPAEVDAALGKWLVEP